MSGSIYLHHHTTLDAINVIFTFIVSKPSQSIFWLTELTSFTPNNSLTSATFFLSFSVDPHIHLIICILVLSNFISWSTLVSQVSVHTCKGHSQRWKITEKRQTNIRTDGDKYYYITSLVEVIKGNTRNTFWLTRPFCRLLSFDMRHAFFMSTSVVLTQPGYRQTHNCTVYIDTGRPCTQRRSRATEQWVSEQDLTSLLTNNRQPTTLSRQSIALLLTTKHKKTKHYT